MVNHERQEIEVVGDPRANADPRRRVPPMLDIALLELSRRRSQDLRARLRWSAADQGHHILQLVWKTIRTAGLVKRGACPNRASQYLINEPTVEHQVHARIRRSHLQRVQVTVPLLLPLGQCGIGSAGLCVFPDEATTLPQTACLT